MELVKHCDVKQMEENDMAEGQMNQQEPQQAGQQAEPAAFSQADVNKMLAEQKAQMEQAFDAKFSKKFAEYKAKAKEEADEAARLAQMTAQEKAEAERDKLQKELEALKAENTRNGMMTESRKILSENGISISDELLGMFVGMDAEATQAAVMQFAALFKAEVEKAVKEKLGGKPPRGTGGSKMTVEEIMKEKDPVKRQALIAENMDLFRR